MQTTVTRTLHPARRFLQSLPKWLLSCLVTLWLVVDDAVGFLLRPAFGRLWRVPAVQAAERWTTRLRPYPTLALLLVPMVFIEPAKLVGLYLIGGGHAVVGIPVLLAAFGLGIALVDRVFEVNRQKILSIGWAARCHGALTRLRDALYDRVRQTALGQWVQNARRRRRR